MNKRFEALLEVSGPLILLIVLLGLLIVLILSARPCDAETVYYFGSDGNDAASGLTIVERWKTLKKASEYQFPPDSMALFQADDFWRGEQLIGQSGVKYGRFGEGRNPVFMGSYNKNQPGDWQNYDGNIWVSSINYNDLGSELLVNPSFDSVVSPWYLWVNTVNAEASGIRTTVPGEYQSADGGFKIDCVDSGVILSDIQLFVAGIDIEADKYYKFSFYIKSTEDFSFSANPFKLMKKTDPWTKYYQHSTTQDFDVTDQWQEFSVIYKSTHTDPDARITFYLGSILPDYSTCYIDSVSFKEIQNVEEVLDQDIGNLIFNKEEKAGRKELYFQDMDEQGDFYFDPDTWSLYLYSEGHPANVYTDIECALQQHIIRVINSEDIEIDGIDVKYGGGHGISRVNVKNFQMRNCKISWMGGSLQPGLENTRFGNGDESWNYAENILVENCIFDQIYDAGITNQGYFDGLQKNIIYRYCIIG